MIEKGILNRHYSDRERAFLNGILSTAFYHDIVLLFRLGACAVEIASDCGHEDVVAFLRDKTTLAKKTSTDEKLNDIQQLFSAVKIGDVDTVVKLLDTR